MVSGRLNRYALLQLVNNVTSALDDKKIAVGVFLDLTVLFDMFNVDVASKRVINY